MKTFKFTLFSIAMMLMVLVSCTNNESVIEEQQLTEESESIVTSLTQLRQNFNDDGSLNNNENHSGNIVFDFCFDFVYPLDLSFNNGTTVTVSSLDNLIDVMFSSTEDLYVNGIAFPFNVETYNDETSSIEVVTITNEEAFISLLESCSFNDFETCECFEDYNPVCVEISDPNGETFTITYPNACYAECDGFTENDFAENCENDYNPGGNECFTLNYPLSVVTNDGSTIVINSEEELGNALYDVYNFDFVYPITVTLENQDVVTINSSEDIEAILTDCFGDVGGNECEECENAPIDPVCIQYTSASGETIITVFPNMCYAECEGFTENNIIDCDDDNTPSDCSEDTVASALVECQVWFATVNNQVYTYVFSSNGTVSVSTNNDSIASGTWSVTTDSNGVTTAVINTNSGNFTNDWAFYCDSASPEYTVVSSASWITNIVSGCD